MDIERLIECVRKHVFLYDVTHVDYKNVSLKNAIWEAIGNQLDQSGDAVRTKWKTLRDGYTKYRKIAKMTTGTNKRLSQYLWSSQLSFLDDYNTPRYGNTTESPPRPDNPEEYNMYAQTISSLARTTKDKRRGTKRESNEVNELYNYFNKKKKMDYDGIDHLFLSYADAFKKFPPREQAILKIKLAKMFSDTELRLLYSDDSHCSPSTSTYDWFSNTYEAFRNGEYMGVKTEESEHCDRS
ncbi:uncharacterized protein LOC121727810 [Aricia agestis]|uniref:uncharacterized protein LOC121727810 n=1 Tax=Aricia agestis TaxID=91739 RepID=UPI001C208B85|nr:uncharacterized protein LOC121727810 [Aricia agestis]